MPAISGPPYHDEFFLEAQEPLKKQPFPETLISRFSPEIREKIYVAALKVEHASEERGDVPWKDRRWPESRHQYPRPEWIQDHQPVRLRYRQRRWPRIPEHQPALLALVPPCANPRAQSRLALLLVCRQIHNEAWHLYYSTNHFHFPYSSSLIQLLNGIGPRCGAELISVALILVGRADDELHVDEALAYLAECKKLRFLQLKVRWDNRHCFGLLKKLRGLESVDLALGKWWWFKSGQKRDDRDVVEREVEEIRRLLLRPKDENDCK